MVVACGAFFCRGCASATVVRAKPAGEKAKVVIKQDARGNPVIVEKKPYPIFDSARLDGQSADQVADSRSLATFLQMRQNPKASDVLSAIAAWIARCDNGAARKVNLLRNGFRGKWGLYGDARCLD
jgi:hypothetical protein